MNGGGSHLAKEKAKQALQPQSSSFGRGLTVKNLQISPGGDTQQRDDDAEYPSPRPLRERVSTILGQPSTNFNTPSSSFGRGIQTKKCPSTNEKNKTTKPQAIPENRHDQPKRIKNLQFEDSPYDDECQSIDDLLEEGSDYCNTDLVSDEECEENDSELDEEFLHQLSHSESLDSSDEEDGSNDLKFLSANKTEWFERSQRSRKGRTGAHNTISFKAGIKSGVNPKNEMDAVLLYLECILEDVIIYSNLQGRRYATTKNRLEPNRKMFFLPLEYDELLAFIGLLILLGE